MDNDSKRGPETTSGAEGRIEMLDECIDVLHKAIVAAGKCDCAHERLGDISLACTRLCDVVERVQNLVRYG